MTNLSVIDEQITRSSFFAGQEFHEAFRTLRREDPVHWTEHPNYAHGFWSVTKHADVKRILEDPITFSSYTNTHLPPDPTPLTYEERLVRGQEHILAFLDPPKHGIMRRPMNKHFSAPAVNRYTDEVEQIVQDIVGEVGPNGQADLVEEIAAQLPVRLIFSMMDVPREDWDRIRKAAVTFMQPEDPAYILNNDVTSTQMAGITTLTDYISDLALKRRTTPGMDFASIIGAMEVEGRPLTSEEVRWFCFLFFTGGLETTRNATAVGLWQFMENPDQAQIVRDNPDALKGAVEEVLRWVTPSKNRLRVATEDVEVGSKTIKKGDWLVTWLVSANRDEDVFDRPDAFDVTRDPNPHLGFGIGEHLCLGRYLARLELGVILSGVLNGLPDMKAAAAPVWVESNNHTAFRSLPVTFTPTLVHA